MPTTKRAVLQTELQLLTQNVSVTEQKTYKSWHGGRLLQIPQTNGMIPRCWTQSFFINPRHWRNAFRVARQGHQRHLVNTSHPRLITHYLCHANHACGTCSHGGLVGYKGLHKPETATSMFKHLTYIRGLESTVESSQASRDTIFLILDTEH